MKLALIIFSVVIFGSSFDLNWEKKKRATRNLIAETFLGIIIFNAFWLGNGRIFCFIFMILITVVWIFIYIYTYVFVIVAATKFCNAFFFNLNGVRLYMYTYILAIYTINEQAQWYDDQLRWLCSSSWNRLCSALYILFVFNKRNCLAEDGRLRFNLVLGN